MIPAQAAAPRLLRAVADSTQPYGPLLEGALHTLQEYLSEPGHIDTVYRTILGRASGEPLSLAVVDKCVALLKRYLPRFKASEDVLVIVDAFCTQAGLTYGSMSPALTRSIAYLQALVVRLLGSQRQRRFSLPTPAHAQHQKSASDTPVTVPSAGLSRAASTPAPLLSHNKSSGSVAQLLNARLSLSMEQGTEAAWAIQHDMLAARFGQSEASRGICHRMAAFLPTLPSPSLWPDADEEEEQEAAEQGLASSAAEAVQGHVQVIAAMQRVQASQAGYNADPALQAHRPKLRDNRPRLLFQYLPYIQQEALQLAEPDIQAVLEANFGPQGLHSQWGVQNPEELWRNSHGRQGRGPGGQADSDTAGPVCASILVKLIIDMYLKAGPALAYPLALLMLQRALGSHSSTTRAKPFDILYNLSVHAEMLYPPSDDTSQVGPDGQDPDSVLEQAWARNPGSAGWPQPDSLHQPLHVFQTWLRQLLWELTSLLAKRGESSADVWQAVLGCVTQLTTYNGITVRAFLEGMPQQVVAALLHCCLQHGWSQQVYCHLIRLAVNMLYLQKARQMTTADDDADEEDTASQGSSGQAAVGLQLSQELLGQLGGIALVSTHFRRAPTAEASRNLLAVMLDHATHRLVQEGEGSSGGEEPANASLPVYSQEGLMAVMPVLTSNHAPAAIQAAAQVGDTGFASAVAHVLQQSLPSQQTAAGRQGQSPEVSSGLMPQQPSPEHLVSVLMDQLEAVTCTGPNSTIPASLQPAVDHTLDCIRRPPHPNPDPANDQQPAGLADIQQETLLQLEEHIHLDEAWQCLAELLCDEDDYAAAVGQTWLYKLLVEAADQQVLQTHQKAVDPDAELEPASVQQEERQASSLYGDVQQTPTAQRVELLGLLPHPLGGPPKPDGPTHLTHQPELAELLRAILAYSGDTGDAGHRFMHVVHRLVLHLKLKCTVPTSGLDGSEDGFSPHRWAAPAVHELHVAPQQQPEPESPSTTAQPHSGSASTHSRSASAEIIGTHSSDQEPDPLVSLGIAPHLMRTSPALSWGQPMDPLAGHRRTQSDARSSSSNQQQASAADLGSLPETAISAEGTPSRTSQEVTSRASQDTATRHGRSMSSVLSTAELTELLQEQAEGPLNPKGLVLHDAPLLGRESPASQLQPQGSHPGAGAGGSVLRLGGGGSRHEAGGPWQPEAAAGLVLSTLHLAMEWILQASPANRAAACQQLAHLLLVFLCTPAAIDPGKGTTPPVTPRPAHPAQVTIDIPANDPAHVTIRMPSPQGSATPANSMQCNSAKPLHRVDPGIAASSSIAWSFLNGLVTVQTDVLCHVPPVLLVRLLHHLQRNSSSATDGISTASHSSLPQEQSTIEFEDVRVVLVLLLIARCNVKQTALQEAGGEALFAELLKDDDARVRYHASVFVQQRLMELKAVQYRQALRQLTQQAQQQNDEKLLQNPYLQVSAMLELRLIDFAV